MDNRNRNIILALFAAVVALSVVAAVVFLMTTENEAQIHNAETGRFASRALADELRQSSDDLTRMARQYAATGDERYKGYFDAILAIRNGTAPRPERYGDVYWDLVVDSGQPPRGAEEAAALIDLAAASASAQDAALFREALANSDALAELEEAAMAAAASGDLARAGELLNNAEYNRRKAEVTAPIDRLLVSLDASRDQAVADGESTRYTLIPVLLGALGLAALAGIGGIAWTLMAFRRGRNG